MVLSIRIKPMMTGTEWRGILIIAAIYFAVFGARHSKVRAFGLCATNDTRAGADFI